MAMLASDPPDVSHVPAVLAHGQPTLASDLALLFGAHGRKTTAALLLTPSAGFRSCGAATLSSTRGRSASLGAATLGTAAGLIVLVEILVHCSAAGRGTAPGGALPLRLFRQNTRVAACATT
jgi:hypothetical protein